VAAVYRDIASGLKDRRSGLYRLLDNVIAGQVDRVIVTYPDRLARFGTGFIEHVLSNHGAVMEAVHSSRAGNAKKSTGSSAGVDPYHVLVEDMVALVTSFAGKIHRLRRGKGIKKRVVLQDKKKITVATRQGVKNVSKKYDQQ